jgi:uncharacterized OsmC-like protein
MKADTLREMQAPFKALYKEVPEKAVITLTAKGQLGSENVTCKVETGRAMVEAGLHPATGGDGISLCSGDMLLEALVACAGVTMKALGVAKDAPVGFREIRLNFDIDCDAGPEQIDTLMKLTERYCVVFQTINKKPELKVSRRLAHS